MFLIAFKSASGGITVVSPANPLPVTGGGGGGGGDVNITSIGGNPVTTAIPISSTAIGAGSDAVGANTVIGQLKEVNETAGAIADTAYDGTNPASGQGYLRRIADEMMDGGPAATKEAPFTDVVAMTEDTPLDPPAEGVLIAIGAGEDGDVSFTLSGGGTMVLPFKEGLSELHGYSISQFNTTGTTATGTIYGLRRA